MVCYMYTHSYVPLHVIECYDNIISGSCCAAPTLLLCSYTQAVTGITSTLPQPQQAVYSFHCMLPAITCCSITQLPTVVKPQ